MRLDHNFKQRRVVYKRGHGENDTLLAQEDVET